MKTIFILYMPGHAGNLINRLISLSPETVPQISKPSLIDLKNNNKIPIFSDRLSLYSFKDSEKFDNWQDFHRTCADFLDEDLYRYFYEKKFLGKFSHITYAIHPYEFNKVININPNSIIDHEFKKVLTFNEDLLDSNNISEEDFRQYSKIKKITDPIFYYVCLSSKYDSWVSHYQLKLKFQNRANEEELLKRFRIEYGMRPIYLDKILNSIEDFENEYIRIIYELGLTLELEKAKILYKEWLRYRGQDLIFNLKS